MVKNKAATPDQPSFRVGDKVRIQFGPRKLTGEIVEDRGPVGLRGRRIWGVLIPLEPDEPMRLEMPEADMEPVPPGEEVRSLDHGKVVEYLAEGGLVGMLLAYLSGGKHQPRAWLCPDQAGGVTHTFVPERGVLGGQVVPFQAVFGHVIFKPKREEVLAFLKSFGLSAQEAEQVVARVGTAP